MKIKQNHCKFVIAQQPTNNVDHKVEYCGLKTQGNNIHSEIKKQSIYAVSYSFITKLYQLESHEIKLVFLNDHLQARYISSR